MKSKQHIYSTCGKKYSRRVRQHANRQNHAASGWRIHCGVEVTELSTNKQHTLSHDAFRHDEANEKWGGKAACEPATTFHIFKSWNKKMKTKKIETIQEEPASILFLIISKYLLCKYMLLWLIREFKKKVPASILLWIVVVYISHLCSDTETRRQREREREKERERKRERERVVNHLHADFLLKIPHWCMCHCWNHRGHIHIYIYHFYIFKYTKKIPRECMALPKSSGSIWYSQCLRTTRAMASCEHN